MKTPYPFQEQAIQRCFEANTLVGDQCGLGKTLTAVEAVKRLRASGAPFDRPILVLARKHNTPFWLDEIRGQGVDDSVTIMDKNNYQEVQVGERDWIITHHEILQMWQEVVKIPWSVVIADECHRFKNRNAKRTLLLRGIPAARRIGLSGTLIEKLPTDLWANLHWIAPMQFRSYWAFYEHFMQTEYGWSGYPIRSPRPGMEEELARVIGPYIIQRTKEQVMPDLPPKIEQRVRVELNQDQKALYERIRHADDILVDIDAADPLIITNVLTRITRLQQVASDPELLGSNASAAKLEWVRDFVEDNPNEYLVLLTRFRETALKLAGELGAAFVVGGKNSTASRFTTGETNIIVGTIDALGESLNLQRASTAIFIDSEWSSIKMGQASDRIHRCDIIEAKHVVYLVAERSVDELILETLDNKWSLIEMVQEYLNRWT